MSYLGLFCYVSIIEVCSVFQTFFWIKLENGVYRYFLQAMSAQIQGKGFWTSVKA